MKLQRHHRATPLQPQRPRDQLFAHSLLALEPVAQPPGSGHPLRIQRLAQLAGGNPALFEHHQAKRNAMPVNLLRNGPAIQLAAHRRGHPCRRACGRAAPAAFKDRRLAAAPQMQPAGATIGIGAGLKQGAPRPGVCLRFPVSRPLRQARFEICRPSPHGQFSALVSIQIAIPAPA